MTAAMTDGGDDEDDDVERIEEHAWSAHLREGCGEYIRARVGLPAPPPSARSRGARLRGSTPSEVPASVEDGPHVGRDASWAGMTAKKPAIRRGGW